MHRSICQRKQTLFGQPPSYFVYGDYILTMDSLISSTCDPENSWRAHAHPACLLCLHRAVEERSNKDAVAVLGRLHLHLTLSPTRKTSTSQNGVRCSRVLLKTLSPHHRLLPTSRHQWHITQPPVLTACPQLSSANSGYK